MRKAVLGLVILVVVAGGLGFAGLQAYSFYTTPPAQPIPFPHALHVRTLGLDCTFCHRNVNEGANASIPAVEQCMFCHAVVGQKNPRAQMVVQHWNEGKPIDWQRVHRVPDHVHFVHEPHIRRLAQIQNVAATQVCANCHGDVGSMADVRQVVSLRMGDCIACHRQNSAPTDCVECHY